jgi:hypothetical protein
MVNGGLTGLLLVSGNDERQFWINLSVFSEVM